MDNNTKRSKQTSKIASLKAAVCAEIIFSKKPNLEKIKELKASLKNEKKGLKRDLERYPEQSFLKEHLKEVKKSLKYLKENLALFQSQNNN
jgi:hypothetical protein